jgi:hypothetical protein
MIPIENRKLVDGIEAPEEHAELLSTINESCRDYGKAKGYLPIAFKPVPRNKYFCAYKQGAATRGEGSAIIGFENRGEGLCLVYHHVVVDLKGLTVQTPTDEEDRWRRIRIDSAFTEEEVRYLCKLAYQCFDKAFR